jgi:hypothetical protein
MEQSLQDSFNQCKVVTVYDKERINNLIANIRFGRIAFELLGDFKANIVFTTAKKGKPDQIMCYIIEGAYLTVEQVALLTAASQQEKK